MITIAPGPTAPQFPLFSSPLHPMPTLPAPTDPADEAPDAATSGFDRPSKTRLKQVSHELQALGKAAVTLPADRLAGLAVAETLLDAIHQYRSTRTHEGRRRQMQYIGKLMRIHNVEPIRQVVVDMQLGRAKDSLTLHDSERWRADLLADDDATTRWIAAHPGADVQQLRSLVRAARKDAASAAEKRSGRAYRELFQFIKEHAAV